MGEYAVDPNSGLICTPAKFEGEPRWAPDLWDLVLSGGADEEISLDQDDNGSPLVARIRLTHEDRTCWPELRSASNPIVAACFTCSFRHPDGYVSPEYLTEARARYHREHDHDVRSLEGKEIEKIY